MAYDAGSWGVAYLNHKVGGFDWQAFYVDLEALGWEATFTKHFGVTSEDFYTEFHAWVDTASWDEKMAILNTELPKIN